MWQEDTKFSTIKRDSQSIANSRREAPLPPIPKDLEPLPPISIDIPSLAANEKPSGNFTANFSGSSSIPKSTGSRHSSAELSFLSQHLAQFDSNISNEWDFDNSASPLSSAKNGTDESVEFPNSPTGEDAGIAPTPIPAATNGASAPAATNGLKRTTSISHPKVQIPRYVRQSFSSRPTDLPGSPAAANSTTTSSRPTSPTNIIPSITATQFTVESPIEEKPVRALLVPKVALRRSDTLPKYPPEPEKLKEAETVDRDVDSLPLNPKVWTPTHVGIYLTHVLKLVPKPLVEDVRAYVTTSSMGGRTFLRMKESDLRELGINQNWVRIISSAREKLRREVLAGKIWGVEEEEEPESHGEGTKSGTNLGVPEAKEMWQKSWRRTKGSKSRGRVKGMAQEFENIMPEDRPDSPSSLSFARAEEARKAISQGWKDRRRRKKKAPATPSDVPALTDDSNVTHPQHVKSDSISSSSEISFEDDQGTRSVIRKRNDSVSSFDSADDSEVSASSVEFSDMDASEGVFGDMMASRFLNKPLEGIDFAFSLESVTTPTEERTIIDTPVEAMKKDEEEKDVESMNGLPPALAELLAPIREDREFETSTLGDIPSIPSRTATSPASIPSAEHNDFTCPPATGSYQSRFINHQKNNVNPYEKIPPNPRKRSSLFLGSGFTKGSIRGLPKGGSGRFTVEELIEMDPELNDFQEDSPFAQEDDERVTMKKVTGKEDMNEADGKMKTMSLASSTRATGTMSRRHHIRDIFGPLVEVPVSELEQETSSSSEPPAYDPAEESTKKTQNGDSLTLLEEKLDGDKNGSVMLVRKSHLRKLEAKLAELENQLANSQDGQSEKGVGKEARGEISHSHKRTDSAISNISNGDDVVALVPAETASRYSSLKGKQPKEWFLAQSDDPSEGAEEPLVSSEANVSLVEKKRELNMGWSELGSFCLAASAGIGVVIGQVVFSKLLRK